MDQEFEAMQTINMALAGLPDEEAVRRVLTWAASRHGVVLKPEQSGSKSSLGSSGQSDGEGFETVADLFDSANPTTEPQKALVVGYWLQIVQGQSDFDSMSANSELKNLGHGVGNITRALENLINRKPRLVIQTRKGGTSKQARKKYKLTVEGIRAVKAMISGQPLPAEE